MTPWKRRLQQRRAERRLRRARQDLGLCIDCAAPHRATTYRRCPDCRAAQREAWHARRSHRARLIGQVMRQP